VFLFIVIFISLAGFTGCADKSVAPPEGELEIMAPLEMDEPEAVINEPQLPATYAVGSSSELAPDKDPREIISRYYKEKYVDTLKAAADYGRLYAYEGEYAGSDLWTADFIRYGLVDARGRVVVDPVYERVDYYAAPLGEEAAYIMLVYPVEDKGAEAPDFLRDSLPRRYMFAAADGAWVSDIFFGDWASLTDERIVIEDWPVDGGERSFRIYDLHSRLIAECSGSFFGFKEGLAVVCRSVGDDYYYYIDRNGSVAIAGPFLLAQGFAQGRANVTIGKDLDHCTDGAIDTQGNFEEWLSTEENRTYVLWNEYIRFTENGDYGIKDMAGNIIVPAKYYRLNSSYERATTAVGKKIDDSYWLIDLASGTESEIGFLGLRIRSADICAGNWCVVNYDKQEDSGIYKGGVILLRDGVEHHFKARISTVFCTYLYEERFVLEYDRVTSSCRADIFDAASGGVIISMPGYYFESSINDALMIFFNPTEQRRLVLNRNFRPLFGADSLDDDYNEMVIKHVADDVYNVRTAYFSGLIRENGQWLVRLYGK